MGNTTDVGFSVNSNQADEIIESPINKEERLENEKIYIWIDPDIENEQNKLHYKALFEEKNIDCKKYDNIDDGFDFLNKEENNFKSIVIIISGKLFIDLYYRIKKNIDSIKFSPTIVVFTEKVNFFINHLKMNNIYYINDLFDTKLIFTNQIQLNDYIEHKIIKGKDLSFEIIESPEQLIIPTYYPYLLEDVNRPEIDYFNSFLLKNFLPPTEEEIRGSNSNAVIQLKKGNGKIQKLISQINNVKTAKEIIIKYWLKIYCLQSDFYGEINKSLRNKDNQAYFYHPFIKLCYEGIKKGFLKSYNKEIYRCSKISKVEFYEINEYRKRNQKENGYPNIIVFSRSFLSFSSDINKARKFRGSTDLTYSILYIIEEIKDMQKFKNKIFNANLEKYSDYNEKEVLVFPFTCFEIVAIDEIKKDKIDYQIKLKYLGNYFDDKDNNLNNYLDRIPFSNYYEELIERNILKVHNYFSNWIEKETIEMEAKKMCFFLESEKDLIVFGNKFISVFDINPFKIKMNIEFNEDIQIIDIIKLTSNRICFYSRDGYIKIITFSENKKKCESLIELILSNKYATKLIYLNNDDFLCIDDKNVFRFYKLEHQKRFRNIKSISEKDKILIMKELSNDRIIYIIEDKDKKKLIKFIDIKNRKKEEYFVEVQEEKNPLKVIDIIILNDYILICYDYRIDFINYNEKDIMIKSSKYFVHEITNIIKLSYDKIILGLYDKEKNESLIREHILRKEDLKNNIDKFDCIGQGKVESNRIENLLKINESQILIKTYDNFMIYERKNEVSDLLKKHLMDINKKVTIIKRK